MRLKPAILCSLLMIIFAVTVNTVRAQATNSAENKTDAVQQLSETQLRAIKSIRSASERKAALPALHLAATIKRIYENMLADKEDQALRQRLSRELDEGTAQMLAIKGQSIRDVIGVLTPEQRRLVKNEMKKPGAPADLMELIVRTFNIPEK